MLSPTAIFAFKRYAYCMAAKKYEHPNSVIWYKSADEIPPGRICLRANFLVLGGRALFSGDLS